MEMKDIYVLGVDIGGSHMACQVVNLHGCRPLSDTYVEVKVSEKEPAGVILTAWEKGLKACLEKAGGKPICGMADHKFASLKGLNIREELHRVTGIAADSILFTNDAAAFGMGVWRLNGATDRHMIGVTLGTGFGACFIVDG